MELKIQEHQTHVTVTHTRTWGTPLVVPDAELRSVADQLQRLADKRERKKKPGRVRTRPKG